MQELEKISYRIYLKKFMTRHVIIKITKTEDKKVSCKQQERNGHLSLKIVMNNCISNNTLIDLNHIDNNRQIKITFHT